jgi:hypothetical protein
VKGHGTRGHVEKVRDFFHRTAFRQELQHFALTLGELPLSICRSPSFLPSPDLVHPDTEIGGTSRKGHPLLALAQIIRKACRPERVLAQFVAQGFGAP